MRVDCVEFEQKNQRPEGQTHSDRLMDSHFHTIALSNHELIIKYDKNNDVLITNFVKIVDFFSYAYLQFFYFCEMSYVCFFSNKI